MKKLDWAPDTTTMTLRRSHRSALTVATILFLVGSGATAAVSSGNNAFYSDPEHRHEPCTVHRPDGISSGRVGRLEFSQACSKVEDTSDGFNSLSSSRRACLECVVPTGGLDDANAYDASLFVEFRGGYNSGDEEVNGWHTFEESQGLKSDQEELFAEQAFFEQWQQQQQQQRQGEELSIIVDLEDETEVEGEGSLQLPAAGEDQEGTSSILHLAAGIAAALAAALSAAAASAGSSAMAGVDNLVSYIADGVEVDEDKSWDWSEVPVSGADLDSAWEVSSLGKMGYSSQDVAVAQSRLLRGGTTFGNLGGISTPGGKVEGDGDARRWLQEETPAPAAVEVESPAPVTIEETPAPAEESSETPSPTAEADDDSVLTPSPALTTPSPLSESETLSPASGTPSPTVADGVTLAPGETAAPNLGQTVAPSIETLAPGTLAPGTLAPGTLAPGTLAPGTLAPGTLAPGATAAPSQESTLAPLADGETYAPTGTPSPALTLNGSVTLAPGSAAPTPSFTEGNMTDVEEVTEETGDVASSAVAVGVAATAATATITAVTATTAATTAVTSSAATSGVTSTVTTAASTTATGGAGGGTSGAGGATVTTTSTTTTSTAAGKTTTFATTVTHPDATPGLKGGMQTTGNAHTSNVHTSNVHSNNVHTTNQTHTTTMGTDPGSVSARSPSATLGLLMIFQMQFVSLLRLMEANITAPFMQFLDNLKWLNLHFEVDVSFFSCTDEKTRFDWSNDDNGTWALNTFLVFGLLAALIVIHILVLSFMEASWLSRANAIHRHRLELLQRRSVEEASAPFDGRSAAAYAKYLDAQNQDRELLEQEKQSAERYLRRHHSVWMYFPHVELLFLLFAYQGASAAEARMIYSGCIPLVILGLCAMIVFPMLMFMYVSRIVWNRLRPSHSPVLFATRDDSRKGCCLFNACRGMCSAWRHGSSMFSWADKGEWVSKNDEDIDLDSRKFRIGFEPLFVDYTQRGTLYIMFLLFEWFAFGLIAGFVTNGTVQTGLICLIYVVDLAILICLRPFSNSIIQCISTMTVLADALTVGLMCYASILNPRDSDDADRLDVIYATAMMIQTLTIILFVVPLYLDAFVTIMSLICSKAASLFKRQKQERTKIKGSCGETMWLFLVLVRENFVGCVKSTWKGPSYKVANTVEQQRRRESLLQPVQEEDSDEEIDISKSFGRLPRTVRSRKGPEPRYPRNATPGNSLRDEPRYDESHSISQARSSVDRSSSIGRSRDSAYGRTSDTDRR